MRIFIKYDIGGMILSVAKVDELPVGLETPFSPIVDENVHVLEITSVAKFNDMEPIDIHNNYKVDAGKMKLVKKAKNPG